MDDDVRKSLQERMNLLSRAREKIVHAVRERTIEHVRLEVRTEIGERLVLNECLEAVERVHESLLRSLGNQNI